MTIMTFIVSSIQTILIMLTTFTILTVYWLIILIGHHILVLKFLVAFFLSDSDAIVRHNHVISELFSLSLLLTISSYSLCSCFIFILVMAVFIVIIFPTSRSFCDILPEPFCHGCLSFMLLVALVLRFFKFSLSLLHDFGLLSFSVLLGLILLFWLLTISLRFFFLVPLLPIAFYLDEWSLWNSFYDLESIEYEGLRVVKIIVTTIIFC